MKLGDIADITKLAGFEFTNYVQYSNNGSIIALRGLNVKNGSLILNDVKYIDHSDFSKLNRSKLFVDDMLFTYVGTVGQVALVDKNDKYYLAPNVARIRFNDCNVKAKFVLYYFQSNQFVNGQMNRLMAESSMKNLTMEKSVSLSFPFHLSKSNNALSISLTASTLSATTSRAVCRQKLKCAKNSMNTIVTSF